VASSHTETSYLRKDALEIYAILIGQNGVAPYVDVRESALYADLVRHGIAYGTDKPLERAPRSPGKRRFSVWFHIYNACNLSCRYCYIPKLVKGVDIKAMDLVKYTVSKRMGVRFSLIRDGRSYKKENLERKILAEFIKMYTWLGDNMPADVPIESYAKFAEWKLFVIGNIRVQAGVLSTREW
jgi:hypothetical protein